MKNLPRDQFKLDYALVYFSDLDSITRAMSHIARAKSLGLYIGSMTATEVQHLNLKKSEKSTEDLVILNRTLEFIYLTAKMRMNEQCLSYIDNLFRLLSTKMHGQFVLDTKGSFS